MFALILIAAVIVQSASPAPVAGAQAPATSAQLPSSEAWPPAGVVAPGKGVSSPEVTRETKPKYTPKARAAGIQGAVEMEAVVLADGTVGAVRVVRSLDKQLGLDDEAVAAMKEWRFKPGKRDGVAVPVVVAVEMTFTLRK
jgi:protein TonB